MDNWRVTKLKKLILEDPDDEFVIFALAQEFGKIGNLNQSIAWYEQLKSKNPMYIGLYYHLAASYGESGNIQKALETYHAGIKIATELKDQHALSELQNAKLNYEIEL